MIFPKIATWRHDWIWGITHWCPRLPVGKQEDIKRGAILTRERHVLDATRPEPLPFYDLHFNRARCLLNAWKNNFHRRMMMKFLLWFIFIYLFIFFQLNQLTSVLLISTNYNNCAVSTLLIGIKRYWVFLFLFYTCGKIRPGELHVELATVKSWKADVSSVSPSTIALTKG